MDKIFECQGNAGEKFDIELKERKRKEFVDIRVYRDAKFYEGKNGGEV